MKKIIIMGLAICFFHLGYSQDKQKKGKNKTETKVETNGPIFLKAYQNVTVEGNKEEEKKEQTPASDKVNFGVRLPKEVKTKRADNDTVYFDLQELKRKYLRDYYNRTNPNYDFKDKVKNSIRIIAKSKGDDNQTYQLDLPPLRANKIYRIKMTEVITINSKYLLFLKLHEEGIDNWHSEEKKWMKMLKELSENSGKFPLIYYPTEQELKNYKTIVDNINLETLTVSEKNNLLDKTIEAFPILKFKTDNPPTVDKMINFIIWIQGKSSFVSEDQEEFSTFNTFTSYLDYINVYEFYKKYLKQEFDRNNYTRKNIKKVKALVDKAIEDELATLSPDDFLPNYFVAKAKNNVYVSNDILNTFSDNFETAFKRSLVPDFGLVAYRLGSSGNIKGTPFVGVNISLAPVNKDVSLSQSRLSIWQRTSIHTGVTLNSLAEDNKRDDFFNNLSLMLGMGYKIGTQATRLNVGGILYNKLDAVTGDKSFAVVPYIGLSIDIEIRKWLQEIIPSYGNNFKKSE